VSVTKAGGGVAVVMLAKEPVNSMNLDLWRQLQSALDACEADPEARFSLHILTCHALTIHESDVQCNF
jgi:enoyl-CoA hydratase/carnithine racemase